MFCKLAHRLFEHVAHQVQARSLSYFISDDLAVVQVHDGREIHLSASDFELSDVCYPLFVRAICLEVPLQDVFLRFHSVSLIGLVLLRPNQ